MRIGVLALQGDFAAHAAALRQAGAETVEVRLPGDLAGCAGLAMPGGESTTLLKLMEPHGMFDAVREFHAAGGALFGTCAGAILLAREVVPAQRSLGLVDAVVERNAYGRQRESFEAEAITTGAFPGGGGEALPMLFIRAPRFRALGASTEILATWRDDPVLVRSGRILLATGHPELTPDRRVQRLFVQIAGEGLSRARTGPIPLTGVA